MNNAMIWGAAGGIGRALAQRLRAEGWNTIGFARDTTDIEELVDHAFMADVTRPAMVQSAVLQASYEIDEVQLWIYAAGDIISERVGTLRSQDWDRIIGANLNGAFITTSASMPLLSEGAHLFFLGAVSERLRLPGLSAYAAAKAGLEAWATALAKEERKRKITVVRPGAVDTPFWNRVPLSLPKDAARPEQIADRIVTAFAEGTTGQLDITH